MSDLAERLRYDTPFYAHNCLSIVNAAGRMVRLSPKPAQSRVDAALEAQRAAGMPMRAVVLKARKEGVSTWVQGKLMQRATQRMNHRSLVVAHDKSTAAELFSIGELMYSHLPDETVDDLKLKPSLIGSRKGRELHFGEPIRTKRLAGEPSLNSRYTVDTANEFEAGRGFTYQSVHLSEISFWADIQRKLTAILNAVPDDPETMVVMESTANGYNHFRKIWLDAERGISEYAPVFLAWFEEPDYARPFVSPVERDEFSDSVGTGPWGADEPRLVEECGVTLEQLNWRRWAITNRTQGDLRSFHQEFPATPDESFLASGRQVFSTILVSRLITDLADDPPAVKQGLLTPAEWVKVDRRARALEIPKGAVWTPRGEREKGASEAFWEAFELPVKAEPPDPDTGAQGRPAGQYIVSVDPSSDQEDEAGTLARDAIEVIDHRSRMQVAEWQTRLDSDLVALQAYLAAVHYNNAWLVVEITGYGLPIAKKIWRDWRYPYVYLRKAQERQDERQEKRLGWYTSNQTKPLLIENAKEMLRTESSGIRSMALAEEHKTYVKDEKNRMEPEPGFLADRLMAYWIAQYVANEKPLKSPPRAAPVRIVRGPRSRVTGY